MVSHKPDPRNAAHGVLKSPGTLRCAGCALSREGLGTPVDWNVVLGKRNRLVTCEPSQLPSVSFKVTGVTAGLAV